MAAGGRKCGVGRGVGRPLEGRPPVARHERGCACRVWPRHRSQPNAYSAASWWLGQLPAHLAFGTRQATCTLAVVPRMPSPALVLLKGHPGAGKSTLGRALAATLGAALVDKDDARDAIQVGGPSVGGGAAAGSRCGGGAAVGSRRPHPLSAHPNTPLFAPRFSLLYRSCQPLAAYVPRDALNAASYDAALRAAGTALRGGLPAAVVDSPLSRQAVFEAAVRVAESVGARVCVVEVTCSDEGEWRSRLAAPTESAARQAPLPRLVAWVRRAASSCRPVQPGL